MLEQLERHETQEHLVVPQLEITTPAPMVENDQRQRRRMVIALVMLLVALGLVLVKDREFWFPVADVADSEAVDDSAPADAATDTAAAPSTTLATSAPAPTSRKRGHQSPPPPTRSVIAEAAAAPAAAANNRVALPPLRVEVIAGDRSQQLRPGSPSIAVELQNGASGRVSSEPAQPRAEVAANVPPGRVGEGTQMTRPEYPLLARQMKVEGAVVLDAQIGKDGGVQALQVVGGPTILADAAREAVKQWRFKPYIQNGQPVETQVPITVNFTIRTH